MDQAAEGDEDSQVGDPLDPARVRSRLGVGSEHRRLVEEVLQVVHDDERLDEVGSRVGLEHGQQAERIAGAVLGGSLLALDPVDRDLVGRDRRPGRGLLGDVEAALVGFGPTGKV